MDDHTAGVGGNPLVGRTSELATLLDTVAGVGPRYAALTSGPGLGKTSVLTALLAKAESLPVAILLAAPSELEESLGFSALADLLAAFDEGSYDALPAPQRTAIRAALLLEEAAGEIEPRAVAVALRTLLRTLAQQQPVALVIDDAHWLDGATAQALSLALRRSTDLPIRVAAATRPTGRSIDDWLPRRPSERVDLTLGPMRPDELAAVVRRSVGRALDRSAARGVAEVSEGNPLFAIEVARQHGRVAGQARGSFDELLSRRLGDLPRPTRLALLTAALAGSPTVDVVAAARSSIPEGAIDELEPAVHAGLVSVVDRIRFAHPLYASAVVAASSDIDVRGAHAGLVDADPGEEVQARHRGLAVVGVDVELAGDLEIAARAARGRGAWDSAAELMRLALDHTPEGEPRAERALTLGGWLARAGRPDEAEPWLREVHATGAGSAWWRAGLELLRLALVSGSRDDVDTHVRELTLEEVPPVVRAEAMIHDLTRHRDLSDAVLADRFREVNARLEEMRDDPEVLRVLAMGLLYEAECRISSGKPWRHLVDRAREIEETVSPSLVVERADFMLAEVSIVADRHAEARERVSALIATSEDIGDDHSLPDLLALMSWLEARAGNWELADDLLREQRASASGQHQHWEHQAAVGLAESRGMRGDTDASLAALDALYDDVAHPLAPYPIASWWAAKGQVLLAAGRIPEAYEALHETLREMDHLGWSPGVLQADAPFMECAIALGRLDEAAARLEIVREHATRCEDPSVVDDCLRIGVLLCAARGDLDEAVRLVPDMLRAHESGVGPLQRGHAYLTAGRVYRRAKAKTRAHDALERATEIYDELGARSYAEQARTEQVRVGLRPRASDDLTDTERQVSELAVAGLRNREIADRLFLSMKTVEAILGRAYRKLGIRSRAELARAIAGTGP